MALALSYDEYGSGAPIVILHGLFGSARNWNSIGKQLGETHRVYALDLRNHGRSPWADAMSYQDLVDDVRGFIEQHELDNVTILGHSMGGKVAMLLALGYGHLVERLIAVDVAPVSYQHGFQHYIHAMQELNLGSVKRREDAEMALRERIPDAPTRMFLLQNLVYREQQFDWRINLPALAANMPQLTGFPEATLIQMYFRKTLIISGGKSMYVQPEHHNLIFQLFPNAGITVIPDAGHWVHVDQPGQIMGAIRAFL
ncbi:MAG: alpha/beta fold hydrolase [Acidiferrobacterales bacterium]